MRWLRCNQKGQAGLLVSLLSGMLLLWTALAGAVEPTAEDVEDAVALALKTEPGVPGESIDVEVDGGIVTLTGSVGNILAKERAARVAETVRGVRSTVNLLKVYAPARPDEGVKADVVQALMTDPVSETWEVDVSVADGVVTLSGSVDSWRERRIAERQAKSVRGVRDVRNEIRVTYTVDRADEEIESEIKSALRWNPHIDDGLIVVEVENGSVTLRGSVGSAAEKRLAETRAWTAGVSGVDASRLRVVAWARSEEFREGKYREKSDGEIRAAVRDAMIYDPRIDAYDIAIAANEGVVTLRGNVASLKAKRSAEQDARNTVGVWRVRSFLKVRPVEEDSDDEIAGAAREAIARHAMLESDGIEVSVSDGEV
ncbi:MAG: BON domain-containing protein, partial [Candidatus Eisenbacteria bacterium]|nr:BON domain-containing protein [Candidatus Eisenbacteria bacterium]